MTFFAICAHIILNLWIGWTVLSFFPGERNWAESLFASVLLGIYFETLLIAYMLFIGLSIKTSIILTIIGFLLLRFFAWFKGITNFAKFNLICPKWYEWLLFLTVGEKILFGIWCDDGFSNVRDNKRPPHFSHH